MNRIQNSKLDQIAESVIREMTRLAEKHRAINLSQGLPDYPCPRMLKIMAQRAIAADENQFSFTYGLEELRNKIAEKLKIHNQLDYDPTSEITITCGVSEGLMATCLALGEPDAEFIIFEPYYENYVPGILLSGGIPIPYTLHEPNWDIDFDELSELFSEHTKAIIINNPMNPTGKVFSADELNMIAELCVEWNAIAICDEIYEDLIFDDRPHHSLAKFPGMKSRTVTIMGFSKTYSITGWRVGYVVASEKFSSNIRKVHDYLTVCAPTPLQHACLAALSLPDSYYDDLKQFYCRYDID